MKQISLKLYLLIIFGGLFTVAFTHFYFTVKGAALELSERHIEDVTQLHHQLIHNNIQKTSRQVEEIADEIQQQSDLDINQLPPSIIRSISFTFKQIPSLTNIYLYQSETSGVQISNVNGQLYMTPADQDFFNTHWRFEEKKQYIRSDSFIYFSRTATTKKEGTTKIILEISPDIAFKTSNSLFINKLDVGFYIYDYYDGDLVYTLHKPTEVTSEQLELALSKDIKKLNSNNSSYNIYTDKFERGSLAFITLIPDHVILSHFTIILNSLKRNILIYFLVGCVFLFAIAVTLSKKLKHLTLNAKKTTNFDFTKHHYKPSRIKEIYQLTQSMKLMNSTIDDILKMVTLISKIDGIYQLGSIIENQVNNASKGKSSLYITQKNGEIKSYEGSNILEIKDKESTYFLKESSDNDLYYFFNLHDDHKKLIGCVKVVLAKKDKLTEEQIHFIQRLVKLLSISIYKHQLLAQQKALLLSFTQSIASAIDAKSPHTAGHCQRVPELTLMLASAAQKNQTQWKAFSLSEPEWEELYLASWLHDCGKLTTADHVIDKATKLDMFTNRIHEIRTRFEILKRDAEILYLKTIIEHKENTPELERNYHDTIAQLDNEFSFIAESNLGNEFFSEENQHRLQQIAQRNFVRTLDKQLGLSWEETQRLSDDEKVTPSVELILQDNHSQQIPWDINKATDTRFALQPFEFKFNFGEVYNLSAPRGTLTNEERFLINDHIIQTITMLEALPYPEHLKNIPIIAGGHHEQMSGKGYPYAVPASELPVTARMMAIADIFEALTASDRPYKTPKTLSESLKILAFMAKNQHIDKEIFQLFLEDDVYLEYANRFLKPEQIDEIDVSAYLTLANS